MGEPIASLCHGPWLLASAGLLDGRVLTSWPGIRDDVVNAGGVWLDQKVVEDGNLVTSRGPQDLVPFVRAITKHFAAGAPMRQRTAAVHSSPQRDQPPKVVVDAMKWLPKQSTRTALIVGAVAAALIAATRKGGVGNLQRQFTRRAAA